MRPEACQSPDAMEEAAAPRPMPAAFLDRDGVINVDRGYVFRCEDLAFTPTAAAGIRLLNENGYRVIVVTNQSGVARGFFTVDELEAFHRHLAGTLAHEGARIDAFYYCAHHADGIVPAFTGEHADRKPSPGMLLRAMRDWPTLREGSFLIGDKPSDLAAAQAAGLPGVLVEADVCDLEAEVRRQLAARSSHARLGEVAA